MATDQRPVCECPEPCACYALGFMAGAQLAESVLALADPAKRLATGLAPEAAYDAIYTAALQAIKQAIGEDHGPDAEEGAQIAVDHAHGIARLLLPYDDDGPEVSLANVASLVVAATRGGKGVGLDILQKRKDQREGQ